MSGTCNSRLDDKVNVVTTPQNPSQSSLNDLRSRYGAPSNQPPQVPTPQAPQDGQLYNPAQPPPPPAPKEEVEFHPVEENPFSALADDDTVFVSGAAPPPSEWSDEAPQRPQYGVGPTFSSPQAPAPQAAPPGNTYVPAQRSMEGYNTSDNYTGSDDYRVGSKKNKPQMGFRGFLANRLNLPVSKGAKEMQYDNYVSLINRSLLSPKVIGFIGGKGGVGKTTTLMSTASTIAELRSKTVVAVSLDYNQTLSLRTKSQSNPARGDVTLLDFATDKTIRTSNDIAGCMRVNHHRLSVLGMGLNPVNHDLLTPEQYDHALEMLKSQYELVFIDFGNIPNSESYWAALKSLDAMVLVTSTENDSMQGARLVENMARSAGLTELLNHTSVIVNHRSPADPKVNLDHFVGRMQSVATREVVDMPWDEHLSESGPVDLDLLSKRARWQLLLTSAVVISSLPA